MPAVKISSAEFIQIAEEALKAGAAFPFEARGGSMFPAIRDGDQLVVAPLDRPARPGDVVLARAAPGRALVHRVVRVSEAPAAQVLLAGDANAYNDGWLDASQVLGRVISIRRGSRTFTPTAPGGLVFLFAARARRWLGRQMRRIQKGRQA